MKVALISDIHANDEALRLFSPELHAADRVVCLGDVVGYYTQVNAVIDTLRELDALCILGNHDAFVLHGPPDGLNAAVQWGVDVARRKLTDDNRRWLGSLPTVWGGFIGGRSVMLAHGSPWNPLGDYLYADSPKLADLGQFNVDLVAFGQTHRALMRTDASPHQINPGSIGQPRDTITQAAMVLWDTEAMTYEPIRRAFDPEPVIELAIAEGADTWINKHLSA